MEDMKQLIVLIACLHVCSYVLPALIVIVSDAVLLPVMYVEVGPGLTIATHV